MNSSTDVPLGGRPTALILSGGASLAAWQGGALYALERRGIPFQAVLGTSAGSLNGAAYLQGDTELLKKLWTDIPREKLMRFSPRLSPPSLFSMDAVRRALGELLSEERCRARRRCWFYAVSVDIRNGGTVQAQYSPEPDGPWDSPFLDHVLGSIAVPFVFPPVEVQGARPDAPRRLLVDGHLTSFAFLDTLVERGARDFLFLNVVGGRGPRRTPMGLKRYANALITEAMQSQLVNSVEVLRRHRRSEEFRAYEFHPSEPLNMSVFGFKKAECRWAFDLGLQDAEACLKDLPTRRIL
ncbi:MAG: hypothetical protein A2X36_05410 [Elusimicrobia bacterium GWA2_69_24]|nr:MAG: hypothetical protein A2X36_05410 [Elusimicrobia bacterium GWA2_69_24]